MTPRAAPGQPVPEPLLAHALRADTILFTGSASVAHSATALALLAEHKNIITFPVPADLAGARQALAQLAIYDEPTLAAIKESCMAVAAILDPGRDVRVTSVAGTDLKLSIAGRRTHSWYGICDADSHGITAWPPGEAHISVAETSASGVAVMDGYISGLGEPPEPLELHFTDGLLTRMRGAAADAVQRLLRVGGPRAGVLCELGVAVNPWLDPNGSNGDKNALGTWHFALGTNASACFGGKEFDGHNHAGVHLDLVSKSDTTIAVDGIPIDIRKPQVSTDQSRYHRQSSLKEAIE